MRGAPADVVLAAGLTTGDVAATVCFLLSDDAAYMTGTMVNVVGVVLASCRPQVWSAAQLG